MQLASLKSELDAETKHVRDVEKDADRLKLARDAEERRRLKADDKVKEEAEKAEDVERKCRKLEEKIASYRDEAVKSRNVIYHLEKDREKFGIQLAETQARLAQSIEDGKLKDNLLQVRCCPGNDWGVDSLMRLFGSSLWCCAGNGLR